MSTIILQNKVYKTMHSDVAIIIPSRMGATRLPRKALVKIGDKTMIEHVVCSLAKIGGSKLYVATDAKEIARVAEKSGAIAIMTDEDCPTGSDRVFQAFQKIPKRDKIKYVINVQCDMPFVRQEIVNKIINTLEEGDYDMVTPVVKVGRDIAKSSSNVKVVVNRKSEALYFSRSMVPHGSEEFLYHVGIYGFKHEALEKFVTLEQGQYENIENLEQLRALEHGIKIGICQSTEIPISVDTQEDLDNAIKYYSIMSA